MGCDKCGTGSSRKGFCPVTLGLALGLTCAISAIFCFVWVSLFGMPEGLDAQTMRVAHNWSEAGMNAVCGLIKGFAGGFLFALIYNLICCCKAKCCGKCSCCKTDVKSGNN